MIPSLIPSTPADEIPILTRAERVIEALLKQNLGNRMIPITKADKDALQVLVELHERVGLKEGL